MAPSWIYLCNIRQYLGEPGLSGTKEMRSDRCEK